MPVYLLPSGSFFEYVIAWFVPVVRFLYDIEPPPPVRTSLEQTLTDQYAQWMVLFPDLMRLLYYCVVSRVAWAIGWNLFPVVSRVLNRIRMVGHVPAVVVVHIPLLRDKDTSRVAPAA
jgi:hypothetical protein